VLSGYEEGPGRKLLLLGYTNQETPRFEATRRIRNYPSQIWLLAGVHGGPLTRFPEVKIYVDMVGDLDERNALFIPYPTVEDHSSL